MCSLSNLGEMDVLWLPIKFGGQICQRWTTQSQERFLLTPHYHFELTSPFNFI